MPKTALARIIVAKAKLAKTMEQIAPANNLTRLNKWLSLGIDVCFFAAVSTSVVTVLKSCSLLPFVCQQLNDAFIRHCITLSQRDCCLTFWYASPAVVALILAAVCYFRLRRRQIAATQRARAGHCLALSKQELLKPVVRESLLSFAFIPAIPILAFSWMNMLWP